MATTAPKTDSKPWYRQFWPWFMIGILVYAVITGVATVIIATTNPDGLVVDDYYKRGLTINRVLSRDRRASELGLEAIVNIDLSEGMARLRLLAGKSPKIVPELTLQLLHPTRGNLDVSVSLKGDGHGDFAAVLPENIPGANWHVVIEPQDQEWRLQGRMVLPEESAVVLKAGG